jgi:hypothetical protein
VIDERQNLREELLAVQAEEFVVGHPGNPGEKESIGAILNPVESALNRIVGGWNRVLTSRVLLYL